MAGRSPADTPPGTGAAGGPEAPDASSEDATGRPAARGRRRSGSGRTGGSRTGSSRAAGTGGKNAAQKSGSQHPARKRARGATPAEDGTPAAKRATVPAAAKTEEPPPAEESPAAAAPRERRRGAVRRALASQRAPRLRTSVATFLVAAALLGVLVSAVALWAHRVVFDTDAYVSVVVPVAQDPAVRSAVAGFVAARAVEAVDLNARLEAALPGGAKVTAPALTSALQRYLDGEIRRFLASDTAQRLWAELNRVAHQQLVSALRDQSESVAVGRDDVKLDLLPLVAVALQKLQDQVPQLLGKDVTLPRIDPATSPGAARVRLQDALGRELPAEFGTVTLLRGDAGYRAKQTLRLLNGLVLLVVVVTVALVAAALLVSVRRRRTALWLGLGALLAFAAARVVEERLQQAATGAVKSQGGATVARSVLTSAIASLNGFLVWIAVAGVVVAVAAFLAGRPAWLDSVGRAFAHLFGVSSDLSTPDTRAGRWMAGHLDLLRVAGVGLAVPALLFVTGSLTGVTIVVLALVVYELALTTYAAGVPRELDAPAPEEVADDTEEPAA